VQIRWQLRSDLRRILKTAGKSAIIVTHDQEEALHIADRVAVMRAGSIEQVGTPEDIYQQPQSRFVAEFVSQANFIPAQLQGNQWHSEIGIFPATDHGVEVTELLIHQEALALEPDPNGVAEISDRIFLGREVMYYLQTRSGLQIIARTNNHRQKYPIGTRVNLSVSDAKFYNNLLCFAPAS
jgi:iron(III) transport system ATP-binding protein